MPTCERSWSRLAVIVWLLWLAGLADAAVQPGKLRASGRAEVNGTRLYYEVFGQGPAVVFLHAGIADSRMWDAQVELFSRQYTVIRTDWRGYGRSDPPTSPYAPTDDVFALLKFLGTDRACVVGLSQGGTVAIDFAAAHPEMTACLVVIAGSPGWERYSDAFTARLAVILAAGNEAGPVALVDRWLSDPMLRPASRQPKVADQVRLLMRDNVNGILNAAPFAGPPEIPVPALSDFRVPTLVMVGDQDDPEIVERVGRLGREMPGARFVAIPGAGHMVNLERPREFNRTLRDFLNGLKRSGARWN